MEIKPRLATTWSRLTGTASVFSLTERLFHAISLVIIVALAYNVPFNYWVGLRDIALLSGVSTLVFALLYYISRFRRQHSLALQLFCIAGNVLFIVNYFLNSGIDGPTDLFFILTMVIMVVVLPVKQFPFFAFLNIVIVLVLHFLQFFDPESVPYTYASLRDQYSDISSAYVIVVVMMVAGFYFIRRGYESEKQSAEQKAAMLRMLNEERNKLFSIISHDLKAPLGNIQVYLESLSGTDMCEQEREMMRKDLLDSTRYTLDMLNNVLVWSRGQMNGLDFSVTELCVHSVLVPQLTLFTKVAAVKKINVEISIDHEMTVMANEGMLQVIVRNLINNAIKFTMAGGHIIFSAKRRGNNCLIMVKDSGTGKSLSLSSNIFYLNNESTRGTNNEKGVGLGLVLCKEFTEAQNGRIWFECDSVSGTTFFVELPVGG